MRTVGSILGLLVFILSINNLFFFFETVTLHSLIDDNTLSAWGHKVSDVMSKLESETYNATK